MKILILLISLTPICKSDNGEIINSIIEITQFQEIYDYLDFAAPSVSGTPKDGTLKPITEFGVTFAGRTVFGDSKIEEISLWTTDEKISPEAARLVFHRLLKSINLRLGNGKLIEDVPNHEDASDVRTDVYIWNKEDNLIALTISEYHNRTGISLSRLRRSLWLDRMGADSGEFWEKTLKSFDTMEDASPSGVGQSNQSQQSITEDQTSQLKSESLSINAEKEKKEQREQGSRIRWFSLGFLIFAATAILLFFSKKK